MPARRRAAAPCPTAHPDPVALAAALTVENVSLGAFAVMTALLRTGGRMRLVPLSTQVGQSYWAVRNNVRRTPYFEYTELPGKKLEVAITEEGREKSRRILKRVTDFDRWSAP
ncbi:hypothetical protein OVA24_16405 [Luteolibacter sp. SL250]|uniref:hypothetical protein n=1 Tax=Luteolibacter sp. SL250 TaxID=2995170 RepID=UPI00226FE23D|nr:hypothetical protein [Luteolibacter sp. SL250]WAC18813.1 hypothetical protein OVA24_16405 [Luteolibacter sp. SL250]